ncbi:MAG TPA: TonB family protein [Bryobacteraceae bacterium]|jgi:TonB family protein
MTPLARALSLALLHFAWQGVVVAVVLPVMLALLRRRSAQARYLASCGALTLMAVLPAITMWLVYRGPVVAGAPTAVAGVAHGSGVTMAGPTQGWTAGLDAWALALWSLGVLYFAARLMWGSRQVSTLRRQGEVAEAAVSAVAARVATRLGLARPVRVLMSTMAEGPAVVGWLRPVILLPAATLAGLTPEQLEAVLAHEFAHVSRYDYLINLLQMVVEALLFYHPAVWWVSARIRHERELCCDDIAVGVCGDAVCYARALTSLERLRAQAPALAMGSTGGRLLYRIERLMGTAPQEQGSARWPGLVALAAGLACFAITTNWARGQAPVPPDQPGVKVDLGKSAVVNRTGVAYPQSVQQKGVKGEVTVQVTVDESGNVSDARVMKGPEQLRKGVLESVLHWKFAEDAAKSKREVKVEFQLPPPGSVSAERDPEAERTAAETQALMAETRARLARLAERYQTLQREGLVSEEQVRQQLEAANPDQSVREAEAALGDLQRVLREAQIQAEKSRQSIPVEEFSIFEADREMVRAQRQLELAQAQAERARREVQAEAGVQAPVDRVREQARMQAELAARQAELQALKAQSQARDQQFRSETAVLGRTIKSIQMIGFTEAVTKNLTADLNLRAGDTLTREAMVRVGKVLRNYDENVTFDFVPTDDGQVEVRISEAASRRSR